MEILTIDQAGHCSAPGRWWNQARRWVYGVGMAVVAGLSAAGCSRNDAPRLAMPATMMESAGVMAPRERSQRSPGTLSREHNVVIDVPESQLETRFHRVVERCTADAAHQCTILQSDLSTGDSPSGHIRLRIDPAAVEELISFASSLGRLEHRSTTVEDLADAIQDTQSRLEMLTNYRRQLLELQAKAATNVDAAIRIASELSTVQTNLERAAGEAANQAKRTSTDIVTMDLVVAQRTAYWRPIREALRDFLGNLSNGMSQGITAVAYIVPWLLVAVPGLYVVRLLWRRRGR